MDTTQIDASAKTYPTAEWLFKRIPKENGTTINSCPTAYKLRCGVLAFVDMDHLLSGTTYDKAPRGRAITIGCQHSSAIGRTSSPVLDTLGANPRW